MHDVEKTDVPRVVFVDRIETHEDSLEELVCIGRAVSVPSIAEDLDRLPEGRARLLPGTGLVVAASVDGEKDQGHEEGPRLAFVVVESLRSELVVDARVVLRVAPAVGVAKVQGLDRDTQAEPDVRVAVVDVELLRPLRRSRRPLVTPAFLIRRDLRETAPETVREEHGQIARELLGVVLLGCGRPLRGPFASSAEGLTECPHLRAFPLVAFGLPDAAASTA
ncbi:MAG: hypothetical protein IPF66_24770 [Holophagales bacterium]|nr:hypothetical protein [Holophagales bacterium]